MSEEVKKIESAVERLLKKMHEWEERQEGREYEGEKLEARVKAVGALLEGGRKLNEEGGKMITKLLRSSGEFLDVLGSIPESAVEILGEKLEGKMSEEREKIEALLEKFTKDTKKEIRKSFEEGAEVAGEDAKKIASEGREAFVSVLEEAKSGIEEAGTALDSVRTKGERAAESVGRLVGWRSLALPASFGAVGFCMAFAVVWWGDIGLRKISAKDMASLERVRTLYKVCTTKERGEVLRILENAGNRALSRG